MHMSAMAAEGGRHSPSPTSRTPDLAPAVDLYTTYIATITIPDDAHRWKSPCKPHHLPSSQRKEASTPLVKFQKKESANTMSDLENELLGLAEDEPRRKRKGKNAPKGKSSA